MAYNYVSNINGYVLKDEELHERLTALGAAEVSDMSKQYIKNINGYAVKDEEARARLALLEESGGASIETCTITFDLDSVYYDGGDIAIVYTDANGNTVDDTLYMGTEPELVIACNTLLYMSGTDLYFGGNATSTGLTELVEYRGKGVYRVAAAQTGTFRVVFDNS